MKLAMPQLTPFAALLCFCCIVTADGPNTLLAGRAASLEGEIASLLERTQDSADPAIDAQIDLRIVARWASSRAAESNDAQLCTAADLRARNLLLVADLIARKLKKSELTVEQANGLKRLHDMT